MKRSSWRRRGQKIANFHFWFPCNLVDQKRHTRLSFLFFCWHVYISTFTFGQTATSVDACKLKVASIKTPNCNEDEWATTAWQVPLIFDVWNNKTMLCNDRDVAFPPLLEPANAKKDGCIRPSSHPLKNVNFFAQAANLVDPTGTVAVKCHTHSKMERNLYGKQSGSNAKVVICHFPPLFLSISWLPTEVNTEQTWPDPNHSLWWSGGDQPG